jgi:hypothetical protein
MTRLDTLLGDVEAFARKRLIGAPPAAMLERFCIVENAAGERAVLECGWNGEDDRQRTLRALKHTMRELGAVAYCIVSEAWTASYRAPAATAWRRPEVMPEARPDRKEVVMAIAANRQTHEFKVWAIVRDKAGQVTGLPLQETPADTAGDLTELLK